MRTIIALLAAFLLAAGGLVCAAPHEELPPRPTITVIVENQNHRQADLDLYCNHLLERFHKVQTSHEQRETVELRTGCRMMNFIIDLDGRGGVWTSSGILVSEGDCWKITVGHRIQYTTWQPCTEA